METCTNCGKVGNLAEDQTDPRQDEITLDARGVLWRDQLICGECMDAAEDSQALADGD